MLASINRTGTHEELEQLHKNNEQKRESEE